MISIVRYNYIVQGLVQGVGFRYQVKLEAAKLNLSGFVRNLDNGNVSIEVQGDPSVIERFRFAIENDIPHAHITHIYELELQVIPQDHTFQIKY